ncbi:UNVERIFIED_CONTAM: hypothetical protein Sradi_6674100 [Sesamum radiatum]|uniref:HAT C-terminal dimerisation domain-containing protein n=1 Tax=Sesamum radiatum TaxID=300843 RepID=A0AAW2JP53_SESRA
MVRKLLDEKIKEKAATLRRKEALINAVKEDRLYGYIPNVNVDSSDEDNDGIDEYGMSALERKQMKQVMAKSRYTGYVEDELRRNPSRGHYGGSSKGSTLGAKRRISQSYGVKSGVEMPSTGFDPHMFPSSKKTIKGMLSKEGMKKVGYFFNPVLQYSNTCVFETAEVRRGVKEVIKKLEPDLIVQANAINEIRLFVDKLGEFGSPLARQAVSTSLPAQWWYNYGDEAPNLRKIAVKVLSQTCASSGCERNWSTWSLIHTKLRNRLATEKLHKLVYAHYNMRLRVRNLMYQREDDDYYNPIDLNHIFHDNDILEEWTRETEEPMLPENDLDWLDEEGRMDNVPNDEDDDASLPLSRWSVPRSSKGKGKHVSSKEKGKQVTFKDKSAQVSSSRKDKHVLHSSSRQNDSDEETAEDDDNDDDDDDDDDGDDDGDGNVHKETQQSHGMTWAQGDENYYATQDTDHGYGRRQPDIQYSMQNLEIDEHRPHQMHGHQGSSTGFGYYNQNMEHLMPSQPLPQVPYNIPYQGVFPQVPYGLPSQPVMYFPYGIPSYPAGVINVGSYTTPYTQNCSPPSHDYYRRIDGDGDGDDHFEPHRHSTFF